MVVYRLANQPGGIPLDDAREPGRSEGLVEFAPANDAIIGDELEKVIVTPPASQASVSIRSIFMALVCPFVRGPWQLTRGRFSCPLATQPLVRAWTPASAILLGVPSSRSKRACRVWGRDTRCSRLETGRFVLVHRSA
jgi:hypothetical protein